MLPRIKDFRSSDKEFRVSAIRLVSAPETARRLIEAFLEDFSLPVARDEKAGYPVSFRVEEGGDEGYTLEVTETGAEIVGRGEAGARNGAATLAALLEAKGDDIVLPVCRIEDKPDSAYRGMMLDLARGYWEIDRVYALIRRLAYLKYNRLHIHLMDSDGYIVRSEAVPELVKSPVMMDYSLAEMRDIFRYARDFGLTVIPELDMPAHGVMFCEQVPEVRCDCENPGFWTLCVSHEKTYEYIDKLIGEIASITEGEYIHVGGDELSFRDLKKLGFWPSWDRCARCRELSEKMGFRGETDLYYYYIRRVYAIIRAHGKKMMMWNDGIDISKTPDLPRDILIHFWRVADPNRGPFEGCSADGFAREGFQIVNSHYPETYVDTYMEESLLRTWYPKGRPFEAGTDVSKVLGGEICAWGDLEHYRYSLYNAITLSADRLWNDAALDADADEIGRAVMRAQIGPQAYRNNIFALLGGNIVPQSGARYYRDIKDEELPLAYDMLRELVAARKKYPANAKAIDEYYRCIRAVMGTQKLE